MGAAIEANQLSKTYPGGIQAVKAVDFEVASGEVFGLLGPNGAGKSTTIGMLTTAIAPTAGTARVGGFDVAARRSTTCTCGSPATASPRPPENARTRKNRSIR
jgi:ABC-type multidrug transport system ATPase subunit